MAGIDTREAAGYKLVAEYEENFLYVDEKNKRFATSRTEYDFRDLTAAEIVEDIETVVNTQTKKKVSLGKAAIGGALLGPAGAIIGGSAGKSRTVSTETPRCNKLRIKLTLNTIENPVRYIDMLEYAVDKDNWKYEETREAAEKFLGVLQFVINNK